MFPSATVVMALLTVGIGACSQALVRCEAPAQQGRVAPVVLDSVGIFGTWDVQLLHQEAGRKGDIDHVVARLWSPDSATRNRLWKSRFRPPPNVWAVGSTVPDSELTDTTFRWSRESGREPVVLIDSVLSIGDPPGGLDGSRDILTVREATQSSLRGRWTISAFGVPTTVNGQVPPPQPEGYFCATKRTNVR